MAIKLGTHSRNFVAAENAIVSLGMSLLAAKDSASTKELAEV